MLKCRLKKIILFGALIFAFIYMSTGNSLAADDIVRVSDYSGLLAAMENASEDAAQPTQIIMTNSIAMPADTPVVSRPGTFAVLSGQGSGIRLTPAEDWPATNGAVTADNVPALLQVAGTLDLSNVTIDASNAPAGVRCVGVARSGSLSLQEVSITGSKLNRIGGLGIYTLGDVVMGSGAAVENISVNTTNTLTGVAVCVGYDRATKVQGSLTMENGSAVRNNASLKQNGACLNGIGIYCQGHLVMEDGAVVSGNTSVYSDTGIAIFLEGASLAASATFDMNGGSISDNRENGAAQAMYGAEGGGLCVYNNAAFTMNGGTISGNLARGGGGAIVLSGRTNCTADLKNGSVTGNRAYANGGGIYVAYETAKLILEGNTEITGNINEFDEVEAAQAGLKNSSSYHANNGGGIYNIGIFEMKGGTITGNRAISSLISNTDVYGQGGGVFNAGTMTMSAGSISSNRADTGAGGGNKAGSGGGIAVRGGDTPGKTFLTGGSITGNTAGGSGPDVWVNADDSSYSIMGRAMDYTANPGELYLGDASMETLPLQIGTLTLPEGASLYICGPLSGSDIRIETIPVQTGTVIGVGSDYEILISDVRSLTDPEGNHSFRLQNKKIITSDSAETAYKDFSKAVVSDAADEVFTGQPVRPEVTVTYQGKTLQKDRDYQVAYYNNVNVSTASEPAGIRVLGMGEYDGSIRKTFHITPKGISGGSIAPVRDRLYSGAPIEPALDVAVDGLHLVQGGDYDVSFSDNTEEGTAKIQIAGKGNYSGSLSGTFNIVSRSGEKIASDEAGLRSMISEAASESSSEEHPQVIYISGQITVTECIGIPAGAWIELIGENDRSVIQAAETLHSENNSMMDVRGNLTLADLTLDAGSSRGTRLVSVGNTGGLVIDSGAVLTGGSAVDGRAIYSAGKLSITGGTISGNDRPFGSDIAHGAVCSKGSVVMTSGTIRDNFAARGAGIYIEQGGTAELTGGVISSNRVSGDVKNLPYASYGGGLHAEKGTEVTLGEALQITGNSSEQYGGAVASFGKLTIDGAQITGNSAALGGGGIYSGGELLMKRGSIRGNTMNTTSFADVDAQTDRIQTHSAACGGGVYVQSGTFTMEDGEIAENTARSRYNSNTIINNGQLHPSYYGEMGNGGGVYVANDGSGSGTKFFMKGGRISGNKAISSYLKDDVMGHGGGVYVLGGSDSSAQYAPGQMILTGGEISGNSASENGDEVYLSDSFQMLKERDTEPVEFRGNAVMQVSGSGIVSGTDTDGIWLQEGIRLIVTGALSGHLTVSAAKAGEAVIAEGTDTYAITETDLPAFANGTELRTAGLKDGSVVLVPSRELSEVCAVSVTGTWDYTGENIRPVPEVTLIASGRKLASSNYSVAYSRARSVDPGEYYLTVSGKGDYREYGGSLRADYEITPVDIGKASVQALPDQIYTGKAIQFMPATGAISYQGKALLRGEDYTVSWSNNKKIGTAKLTFTGEGNFTGSKTVKFRILPKQAKLKKLTGKKAGTLTITWQKDPQATGYQILIAKDKKFKKSKMSKTVKKYSAKGLTIKGLKKNSTWYAKVRSYRTVSGVKYYGPYSTEKKLRIK